MLLSDTLAAAENARQAGVRRRVSVYEGMFHVFQMSMDLIPESREAWDEVARFMQIAVSYTHLDVYKRQVPGSSLHFTGI